MSVTGSCESLVRGTGMLAQPVNTLLATKMEPDSEELELQAELQAPLKPLPNNACICVQCWIWVPALQPAVGDQFHHSSVSAADPGNSADKRAVLITIPQLFKVVVSRLLRARGVMQPFMMKNLLKI